MKFYVYAHVNPVTLVPFYIGKGKAKRCFSTKDRSQHWNNVVNKYGLKVKILKEGLTEPESFKIEKQYIERFGFIKTGGTLVNKTIGGTGGNTFDPINGKNWNSGKTGIYTNEALNKMRQARIGKKLSPETKVKVLAGLKLAALKSLESRTHKVKCLATQKIWDNRTDCSKELAISIHTFKQRIYRNQLIKGNYLQFIK